MIANPVIKKSGGGQTYNITDSSGLMFPESAEAGAIVYAVPGAVTKYTLVIADSDGNNIPWGTVSTTIYFVMPASDVTAKSVSSIL